MGLTDSDRMEWIKSAPPQEIRLQGMQTPLYLVPKVFKSGSVGWFLSQKAVVGESPCQVNFCITVIGSKREVAAEAKEAEAPPLESPLFPSQSRPEANGHSKPTRTTRKRS